MKTTKLKPNRFALTHFSSLTALVITLFSALIMSACGGGSSGSSNGIVTTGPNGIITGLNCPVGQIYSPTSGCVSSTADSLGRYTGQLSAIDQSQMVNMLTLMGACNQYSIVNIGLSNCSSYSSRAFVVLNVSGTYGQGTLYVGASSMYNMSSAVIPLTIAGPLNPINNSTGYVIQSGSGLALYIDTATLGGSNMPGHITYQGSTLANVTLTSY